MKTKKGALDDNHIQVLSRSHNTDAKDSELAGCYAVPTGKQLPSVEESQCLRLQGSIVIYQSTRKDERRQKFSNLKSYYVLIL